MSLDFNNNPWLSAITLGAGTAAGAIPTPTNTSGNTDSSGSSSSTISQFIQNLMNSINSQKSTSTNTSVSTPNLSPATQSLIDNLTTKYSALASNPIDMNGYKQTQSNTINNNANIQKASADNIMASRGLASSPAAATTDTNIDNTRFANINSLAQSIPLLKNQLQQSNLSGATSFMAQIPHGSTVTTNGSNDTSGSTSQSSTQNSDGSTYNTNNNSTRTQQQQQAGGGAGGFLGALGSILPLLFL